MKISHIFAAVGLTVAALGVSSGANAQRYDGDRYRGDHVRYDRHDRWDRDRRWHGHNRYDRCYTEWRHHHRVRICR